MNHSKIKHFSNKHFTANMRTRKTMPSDSWIYNTNVRFFFSLFKLMKAFYIVELIENDSMRVRWIRMKMRLIWKKKKTTVAFMECVIAFVLCFIVSIVITVDVIQPCLTGMTVKRDCWWIIHIHSKNATYRVTQVRLSCTEHCSVGINISLINFSAN